MTNRLLHLVGWILAVATALAVPVKKAHGQTTQPSTQPVYVRGLVGENLGGLRDSTSHAFIDAMKEARAFEPLDDDADKVLALRPDGWPAEDFQVVVFTEGNDWHRGTYSLSIPAAPAGVIVETLWPGTKVGPLMTLADGVAHGNVVVTTAGTPQLKLRFRNTNGGLANVELLRPGYASADDLFTNEIVNLLRAENAGVLRSMEWLRIPTTKWTTWSSRTPVGAPSYTAGGVPPEVFIELCNRVGAEPWVNVWHTADDDTVYLLAKMVRDRTPLSKRVWVEYGNELWNTAFSFAVATQYCADRGTALLNQGDDRFHPSNEAVRGWQWAAKRSAEVGEIFRRVLGRERVDVVLAGCAANPGILEAKVAWIEANVGPLKRSVDAIAIAPYYGSGDRVFDNRADLTAESYFAAGGSLETAARVCETSAKIAAFFKLARDKQVLPVAYESGFYPQPKVKGLTAILKQDPRLEAVHRVYLDGWFRGGGGLMLNFTHLGVWNESNRAGATDRVTRVDAPQVKAIAAASASHPMPPAPPLPVTPARQINLLADQAVDLLDQIRKAASEN